MLCASLKCSYKNVPVLQTSLRSSPSTTGWCGSARLQTLDNEKQSIKHNENSNLSYTGVLEYLGSKEQLRCFSLEICVYVFGNTEVVLSVQGQYIHTKTY